MKKRQLANLAWNFSLVNAGFVLGVGLLNEYRPWILINAAALAVTLVTTAFLDANGK